MAKKLRFELEDGSRMTLRNEEGSRRSPYQIVVIQRLMLNGIEVDSSLDHVERRFQIAGRLHTHDLARIAFMAGYRAGRRRRPRRGRADR